MARSRKKRNLAAVSRETPEITKNNQSQQTLEPGMAQEYISQVFGMIGRRVNQKLSQEINRTDSHMGAFSELYELLLNPQVRTCSVAVPGTSRNNGWDNREPTGDRSLGDPCPEVVFSACHPSNLNVSEQERTHHSN